MAKQCVAWLPPPASVNCPKLLTCASGLLSAGAHISGRVLGCRHESEGQRGSDVSFACGLEVALCCAAVQVIAHAGVRSAHHAT